jgi:hypothetical protein
VDALTTATQTTQHLSFQLFPPHLEPTVAASPEPTVAPTLTDQQKAEKLASLKPQLDLMLNGPLGMMVGRARVVDQKIMDCKLSLSEDFIDMWEPNAVHNLRACLKTYGQELAYYKLFFEYLDEYTELGGNQNDLDQHPTDYCDWDADHNGLVDTGIIPKFIRDG